MISNACKYGIRAIVFIASRYVGTYRFGVSEISAGIDAPEPFCAKILQTLVKNGIVSSAKGPGGGFYMVAEQFNIPVLDVVRCIDGVAIFSECGLGLKECSEQRPCPMHYKYKEARQALFTAFRETTINELAGNVNQGTSFLSNLVADSLE